MFQRCLLPPSSGFTDNGGHKHLWNAGKSLPDYTAQQLRRQPSSYTQPWEPEISQRMTVACVYDQTVVNVRNRTYFSVISTLGSRTYSLVQGIQHSSCVLLYGYRLYWNCKRNKRQSPNIHRSENCKISMLAVVSYQNLIEGILDKVREVL
jgi:hypothetical protein